MGRIEYFAAMAWLVQFLPLLRFFISVAPSPFEICGWARNWEGVLWSDQRKFAPRITRKVVAWRKGLVGPSGDLVPGGSQRDYRFAYIGPCQLCLHDECTLTGTTYHSLAEAVLMGSVADQAVRYTCAKIDERIAKIGNMAAPPDTLISDAITCLQHLGSIQRCLNVRVWYMGFLSNGLQLQLQITFLALAMVPRRSDDFWSLSFFEALISILLAFARSAQVAMWLHGARRAQKLTDDAVSRVLVAVGHDEDKLPRFRTLKDMQTRRSISHWCLLVAMVIFGLNLAHVFVKFVMAFWCEDHMFNLSLSSPGCVDLEKFDCFKDPHFHAASNSSCRWTDPCCHWKGRID